MTKQEKKGFINEAQLDFVDISAETEREYCFPNGNTLTIKNPLYLNVSKSGGHRVYTSDNCSYYVKPNESWYIKWKVNTGNPNFVK